MNGFIVDTSSSFPFMAFSQGDTYVFMYSFLLFSFAKAAALVLCAPVEIFNQIETEAVKRRQVTAPDDEFCKEEFWSYYNLLFSKLNQVCKRSVKNEL